MAVTVDDFSQIVGIKHHDGEIAGIAFSGNTIRLSIKSFDNELAELDLTGVEIFVADNLREGNIIDRMYLWHVDDVPSRVQARVVQATHFESYERLKRSLQKADRFFYLESSFGAEIMAIVGHVNKCDGESPR